MTTEAQIESEIQAKGLTAPRVTPADIEANIASTHYFTGDQGVFGAAMDKDGTSERKQLPHLALLTFCVLILRNGTKVVGINYGAIDPAQHDPALGRTEARNHAIEQVWPLMGYQLREQLYQMQQPMHHPV